MNFLAASSNWSFILILVVMGAVMYFSMIRPQKKQQQKRQDMFSQMKKGDRVVTIGGLHGVIDSIDNDAKTVVIDSDGIYLTFNLGAIRDVKPQGTPNVPGVTTKAEPKTEEPKAEEPKAEEPKAKKHTTVKTDPEEANDMPEDIPEYRAAQEAAEADRDADMDRIKANEDSYNASDDK